MSLVSKCDISLKVNAALKHQKDAVKQIAEGINHLYSGQVSLEAIFDLFPELNDDVLYDVKEALAKLAPTLAILVTEDFIPDEALQEAPKVKEATKEKKGAKNGKS